VKRPFEGLGFTLEIVINRILDLAKTNFENNPSTYKRLYSDAKSAAPGVMAMVCAIQPTEWQYHVLRNEQHILDVRLLKLIGEWEHGPAEPLSTDDAKLLADLQSKKQAATIRAKKAAAASHAEHNRMKAEIQAIWSTGKYKLKTVCAEEEYADIGMSFSAAIKALRNLPKTTKP